jgi:Rnl2 family RNA ligase
MFVKYPSLVNHYNKREIRNALRRNPGLDIVTFVITEKIHGANIQVNFEPDGSSWWGSRNQSLGSNPSFYGAADVFPKVQKQLAAAAAFAHDSGETVTIYGELFGGRIQKGVEYGNAKRIRFFDIALNGHIKPLTFFMTLVPAPLSVPILKVVKGLEQALSFDARIPTTLYEGGLKNICEGIVIKPLAIVAHNGSEEPFVIKVKNEEFLEKKAHKKTAKVLPNNLVCLREAFLSYLVPIRVQSLFSKEGPMESKQDIKRYLPLLIEDAWGDFIKDYPEVESLSKTEVAQIRSGHNAGHLLIMAMEE